MLPRTRLMMSSLGSKRFSVSSSRKQGREQNKNNGGGGGGWRVEKETLARSKPHNQTRYVLFTCVADLYLSDLWSQIKNALDWYLFESCLCESLSDLSSSKYSWR